MFPKLKSSFYSSDWHQIILARSHMISWAYELIGHCQKCSLSFEIPAKRRVTKKIFSQKSTVCTKIAISCFNLCEQRIWDRLYICKISATFWAPCT